MTAEGAGIEISEYAQRFVMVGNAAARDGRISFRARGLHHHLLSLPPGVRVTTVQLAKSNPEGRDAIRAALNELIKAGYVTKVRRQDARGHWSTTMIVHDQPQPLGPENPQSRPPRTDFQASVTTEDGFPGVGNPGVGKLGAKGLKDKDPKTKEDRSARAREADPPVDNSGPMTDMIISEIEERTRVRVSRDHAAQVARQILGRASSPPRKPLVFVRAAIRREEDPQNFVPTNTPPPYRPAPPPAKPPAVDADPWAAPPRDQGGDLLSFGAGLPEFIRELRPSHALAGPESGNPGLPGLKGEGERV